MMSLSEAVLAVSSSIELSLVVKSMLVLGAGLAILLIAKRASAAVRHLILAATFIAVLLLPVIAVIAPPFIVAVPVASSGTNVAAEDTATGRPANSLQEAGTRVDAKQVAGSSLPPLSWLNVLRAGWLAGMLLLLATLGVELWKLRWLRRRCLPSPRSLQASTRSLAQEAGIDRPVQVLLHEEIHAPLTYGIFRPAIILPADAPTWDEADLQRTMIHELEHVRRGDWAVQFTARVACAMYWFQPLAWVAWRRLCLEAERACDDAVIRNAADTEYADQLVSLAQRMPKAHGELALGMAHRSDLSNRVAAILDDGQRRGRAGLVAAFSAAAVAAVVLLAIGPLEAIAQSAPGKSNGGVRGTTSRPRLSASSRALYEAAQSGDLEDIQQLLNAGADVNTAIKGDGSPLIAAAREGHITAVQLLLDRGANPNMGVEGDGNPLIMAAREGHEAVITLLLERGARIEDVVPGDENALIQASGAGEPGAVKLLVSRGANVNSRVESDSIGPLGTSLRRWRTPLGMARAGGHSDVVAFLLASGARE